MRIVLDLQKSVEKNAEHYFELSKKAKRKYKGAKQALKRSEKQLKKLCKDKTDKAVIKKDRIERKRHWYEKFRWFFTTSGKLVVAGRDASTNEMVIKKHTQPKDLVFHTNIAGSPFGVLKTDGQKDALSLKETADFIATYSRAWKLGLTTLDVFYVSPDKVTKEAPSGEYIQKGSFMIYGEKNALVGEVQLAVGIREDGSIMGGPPSAVKAQCLACMEILQGREKTSAVAKKIQKKIGGNLDDIIRVLPAGGCKIKYASQRT